ncbi:MFS transporter [Streptomyces microflavus]|uniref:MFS transporter n=1 Tax=Streptomyces microflavus TaxID=1919 RepID=A0A6N9VIJ1_STRMI|nr:MULTISPECIES: MFS transporter [Streptomyces]MBK3583117.1 MFS transporter [Streptomyces sp. MBT57]QTA33601.1 DHA2 family efflux MFS transporter permease subunit [Streptomyces sp. CA-256286]MBW3360051.1 MFS transporter [Streptomyces sp. 09ZI22]NEB72680.1 MFS transporter [Streptomyces microflavus]OXY84722.1 MFS transporter [Streptomyces sp. 2R]
MSMQDRTEAAPPGAGTPPGSAAPAPSGDKLGLALAVIAAAQLMLVLDNTIVAVALPSMQSALGLSDANLGWVITAYALAFGGLLLAGGRAGDLFGRRRVFRTGLVVFTLASLLGGLAGSGEVLLIARVLQGVGAAIAAPTALSLLASTFPAGPARNKALGVYGAMGGLGSVVGLLLGGALTEFLSWRWVMYINIPIAVAVLIGTSVLKEGERDRGKVDVPGALTATFGFGSLVYGINRAGEKGLGDSTTLIALAVAIVLIVAFIAIQRSSRAPMVPGAVVADKSRAGANAVMFLVGAGMFATFYFLTLYMQIVKGYEPMITGLAYLPFAIGIGIAAGGVGPQLLAKVPERSVIAVGLVIGIAGMVWLSLLEPGQNAFAVLLPAQLVCGFGLGLVFVTVTIISVRGVSPEDTGIAAGLINTSQQIGGAVGLAILAATASVITEGRLPGDRSEALTTGYSYGLLIGGGIYLLALIVTLGTIKATAPQSQPQPH